MYPFSSRHSCSVAQRTCALYPGITWDSCRSEHDSVLATELCGFGQWNDKSALIRGPIQRLRLDNK